MKLLMAVSSDGYLATGPNDRMRWTGVTDKAIFRLLTLTVDRPIFAGWKTAQMMPPLHGRVVHPLSRQGLTLKAADEMYPESWLIGGPTVALEALRAKLVSQVILCWTPATLYNGISSFEVASWLPDMPAHTIEVGEVKVMLYVPHVGGI